MPPKSSPSTNIGQARNPDPTTPDLQHRPAAPAHGAG